jgi:metal-responsive CopG/Arc/MetJ family transcriptional regulator
LGNIKKNRQGNSEPSNQIVNVRLPPDLLTELDTLVDARIFHSRSEAIREFAREYVLEQEHQNAKISERGGRRW